MERNIILTANDNNKDIDVTFMNVNGKDGLIPFLLNIISAAADFLNKPTGEFTAELIKNIGDYLPVNDVEIETDGKPDEERGFVTIAFDKQITPDGKRGYHISAQGVNSNSLLNILNTYTKFLINQRNIPVPAVLFSVSKAIDENAEVKNLVLDDTDCDNDTCADCECRCDKSTEVKASADTNGDTEATGDTVAPPDYKGKMGTPTNLRSTGDTDIPDKYRETSFG